MTNDKKIEPLEDHVEDEGSLGSFQVALTPDNYPVKEVAEKMFNQMADRLRKELEEAISSPTVSRNENGDTIYDIELRFGKQTIYKRVVVHAQEEDLT